MGFRQVFETFISVSLQLTHQYERSVDSQRKLEEELRQVADKREAVSHWEEQIKEIIQWLVLLRFPEV